MVKEELNTTAGVIALVAILAIMIILLAVLALVVVKALADSPWGVFTVGATIPIAIFMGCYLRFGRIGKVLEASAIGVIGLLLAVWGGKLIHQNPQLAAIFSFKDITLAWTIIVYGLAASVLPVWFLLAPRDYLSTFVKLGTIVILVLGVLLVLPNLRMPAITRFVDGSGPVVAGKLFPFCFITIACGAISGFHTLIASGTTPKIMTRESYARPIGYGAMCLESLVAIMAIIAACTLDPGVYLSMNIKGAPADTVAQVTALGFPVTVDEMNQTANQIGEKTLFGRTGGAATLAVGMAHIFSRAVNGHWLDLWYHFAIMFEALFILTTLDAGTRVGRYLLQDALGQVWKPLGETKNLRANVFASLLVVAGWGYFLIQGVYDPLGGINSLWPLFGIANQMLAAIALCLGTTVILKMGLLGEAGSDRQTQSGLPTAPAPATTAKPSPILALVAFVPLVWLLIDTMTAGYAKIFDNDPRIGFLAQVKALNEKVPTLEQAVAAATAAGNRQAFEDATKVLRDNRVLQFNNRLDAVVTAVFIALVSAVALLSFREWILLLARRKLAVLRESEPTWLPEYAIAESRPLHVASLLALGLALLKELSGQSHLERAQSKACHHEKPAEVYCHATEQRFNGIRRCC
jgi:carbon starvation protein